MITIKTYCFGILLILIFNSNIKSQIKQNITSKSFCVSNIKKDSIDSEKLEVNIFSKVNLNTYPFVFAILNSKGDTIAKEFVPEYFGQAKNTFQGYHLKNVKAIFDNNQKYIILFNTGIVIKNSKGKNSKQIIKLPFSAKNNKCNKIGNYK